MSSTNIHDYRQPAFAIEEQFTQRWSPRALTGEPVAKTDLLKCLEAARWAPSCFNDQPWRFVAATRDEEKWSKLMDCLVDANKAWASEAGALVLIVGQKNFARNGKPNRHYAFDSGAAWMSIALQAQSLGLVTHAMGGFDPALATSHFSLSEEQDPICVVAIGYQASKESLPPEIAERELPSGRLPLDELLID